MKKYKHIPPLRALKAFESTARHLSLSKAAKMLFVTQSAISQQIKSLESKIEVKLFTRNGRKVELTSEGHAYLFSIREALEKLETATRQLADRNVKGGLKISTLPSFATKWLAKRIWRFQESHPEIEVSISANDWLADFNNNEIDIAIRYGRGDWPNVFSELLFEESVFPICNTEVYKELGENPEPKTLLTKNLIHDDFSSEDWKMWFKQAGIDINTPFKGTRFSHATMMLESVESSNSLALGHTYLVIDDLKSKNLYAPFNITIPSTSSYYIVCPKGFENSPRILVFREWIKKEAKKSIKDAKKILK